MVLRVGHSPGHGYRRASPLKEGTKNDLLTQADNLNSDLPSRSEITRTPCGLVMRSLFVVHKYFIMVTIENERRMCYNKMNYTPGGVYVEYD